jgi:hypothetical protein
METPWYVDKKYKVVSVFNHEIDGVMVLYYRDGLYALTHFHHLVAITIFIKDGKAFEDEKCTIIYDEDN